jgi:hypothetical protein
MIRIIAILIANLFVVDYGVMPDGKESSVYVIQIEPEVAGQLVEGYVIESVIPPELQGIRKFRIQIGNEKLTKPTPPIVVSEGDAAKVPDVLAAPSDVLVGEASDIDIDAFPVPTDPAPTPPAETLPLIPDEIDTMKLPGVSVPSDTDDQGVREVLEPDETPLPQLTQGPTRSDAPVVVIEPVFDKVVPGVLSQTTEDIDQSENAEMNFLDNDDTENRIVLEELPDLSDSLDKNTVSVGVPDDEPELLRDKETEFVRLANATSSSPVIPTRISNVVPNKPLPPEPRAWPLFSVTLLGLIVSVGGNLYLGMTVLDFYRKRNDA